MRRLGRALANTSLRARLTALTVALVAVGLVTAGIATHYALRGFLIERVDQEFPTHGPLQNTMPPNSLAEIVSNGRVLGHPIYYAPPGSTAPPDLEHAVANPQVGTRTIGDYRVRVTPFEGPNGPALLVLAIPLSGVHSTLERLDLLELLIGVAVLGAVGLLAYLAIRREFRPLVRIEDTAAAIAAGDLSRRVEDANTATEVGRLGASLNAMLTQIELAFKEREASEDRLRRFVADASHELRTPLTSVRGYAELFRRGASEKPEDLELVMGRIEAEAERMGILVEDLLLLAKIDQGRPLAREPVDVSGLVTELASDQRMLHPEWPIVEHAEPGIIVTGDDLRIRQAIGNLLSNARAHTPPGTDISITATARDGRSAVIEVADNGPGVPPEIADKVFERFFRADDSRTRASGGAGLGLAIVAAIAAAHGGHADLDSSPGEGSRFRIVLPLAAVAPDTETTSSPSSSGDTAPVD